MNREEIKNIIPHRDNMLLIDEVELRGEKACGKYRVRGDEWFLQGHFPGNPIVPGVILCEMLAQSACVLLASGETDGKTPFFTSLDNVRFKSPVKPGDELVTECEIVRARPPFFFAQGQGFVAGKLCVKADFSFALT